MPPIVVVGKNSIDVARVKGITPNAVEGARPTYTLRYDGAHDDTDETGTVLPPGQVANYAKDMPKEARANVGNRQTFSEAELVESGFFDAYNELHPNAKIGPQARKAATEEKK